MGGVGVLLHGSAPGVDLHHVEAGAGLDHEGVRGALPVPAQGPLVALVVADCDLDRLDHPVAVLDDDGVPVASLGQLLGLDLAEAVVDLRILVEPLVEEALRQACRRQVVTHRVGGVAHLPAGGDPLGPLGQALEPQDVLELLVDHLAARLAVAEPPEVVAQRIGIVDGAEVGALDFDLRVVDEGVDQGHEGDVLEHVAGVLALAVREQREDIADIGAQGIGGPAAIPLALQGLHAGSWARIRACHLADQLEGVELP